MGRNPDRIGVRAPRSRRLSRMEMIRFFFVFFFVVVAVLFVFPLVMFFSRMLNSKVPELE